MTDAALRDFALGTFSAAGGPPFAGLVIDGRIIAVRAAAVLAQDRGAANPDTVLGLLQDWESSFVALKHLVQAFRHGPHAETLQAMAAPIATLRVHPPVDPPHQIFCTGMNYKKHVVELIMSQGSNDARVAALTPDERRRWAEAMMEERAKGEPFVFLKAACTVTGAFDTVVLPHDVMQPDWELELAAIIGRPARRVGRADALAHVAGYAIVNDVTARDRAKGGAMIDWLKAKSQPTFFPFGPYLVPAAFVGDPQQLRLTMTLNGEVKQDAGTADMLFDVARQIEYLSHLVQLMPGDVIATGSPPGNGGHWGRFLQPGDVVEGSITGLGTQRFVCKAEGD